MGHCRGIQRSLGLHKGMVDSLMKTTSRFAAPGALTKEEIVKVESKANKAVKAALLISR